MPDLTELAFATIPELGRRWRAREFSAVELATFFLDRADSIGRELNAIVTLTRELGLKQAAQADRDLAAGRDLGPLHGIPYGAKDLLSTAGIPTSWGAAPYKDQVFSADATVVRRLQEAGAVLIAKLAMVEIAGGFGYRQAHASFTGPGLNPWDKKAWSGGSSSGPGSAVAAGIVPFAIGSETWGSIMTPAAYCGLSGLRPTYGRVSRHGAMALSWTMDKLGPMCRTAEDCGLVLHAIAGQDPEDPTSAPLKYAFPPQPQATPPFKLATLREPSKWQPEVKQNFEASLESLKEFATIEEVELPDLPYSDVSGTLISCEMAAAFEKLVTSGDVWELTAAEDRPGGHAAQFIPAKDYINAFRIRSKIQRALDEILARFDAIVTPTMSTVAAPNDTDFRAYFASHRGSQIGAAGNAAGIPALSVPNGFGERGLPTGVQFVGRAFEENKLLAIAQQYQSVTQWHTRTPKL
jgi:aspartyl-tRNA(Asn)/glutamyl-tRNA(Gln) amidotransferase subunit A